MHRNLEHKCYTAQSTCYFPQESSAEAGSIAALTDAPTWIVDPVDGTTNFVHGFPMTCVSIAFGRGGKVRLMRRGGG